jgi:VanZ family protein
VRVKQFFLFSFFANFALTLYLFFQQDISSGVEIPHFDKVGHFIAFFVLATCLDLGTSIKRAYVISFLAGYGVFVELVQDTIPGRQASLADILADVSGVIFYYFVFQYTIIIKKLKSYD